MAHYILVHGAWQGAWCWAKLVPLLERAGHTVEAIDLPGMGDDPTPPQTTSLASYAARIVAALDAAEKPVVLVGHSMGGVPVSLAAEARPEKIKALVYVCAFLLRDGEMLLQHAESDPDALVLRNGVIDQAQGLLSLPLEKRREIFYGDCTDEDVAAAAPRHRPQFMGALTTPVQLSEARFGSLRRVYIECTLDQAITLSQQRRMVAASPCAVVHTLEAGHSPFLSQPEKLASLLQQEA